jgi:DNA/RNA-binding domain of Phe-tRNA-synthetase-like protein
MKISIEKSVFKKFPKLRLVFLQLENMDNHKLYPKSVHLVKEAEKLISLTFTPETLINHNLISPWSVAKEEFGRKAKSYHTSVELLVRDVLKQKTVVANDVLTNLIKYISLKRIVPIAVDDMDKILGDLTFSLASGWERGRVLKNLEKGTLYYKDEKSVLGAKLDYWKSKRTLVQASTTKALVHLDIMPPITPALEKTIIKSLKGLIKVFCGGKIKIFVLDKQEPVVSI